VIAKSDTDSHWFCSPDPDQHSVKKLDPDPHLNQCGSVTLVFSIRGSKKCQQGAFTLFFKEKKVIKKSQNSRNQGFSYYFA
jgi:hypothetical protein